MKPIFIHTRITGDFNVISYSKKKLKSIRNETREQVWFIPNPDGDKEDERKIKSEIVRGNQFFNSKEGFLFGAYYELTKLGTLEKRNY